MYQDAFVGHSLINILYKYNTNSLGVLIKRIKR